MESKTATKKKRSLLSMSVGYLGGQLGVMAVSVVTFPLFTRVLSRSDYGLLSLVNTTLSLAALLFAMGLPNSIVRFLPEYQLLADSERQTKRFAVTMLFQSAALATCGVIAILAILPRLYSTSSQFVEVLQLLKYVAPILIFRATTDIVQEFFRVNRRQALYNGFALAQKLANAGCAIGAFTLSHTLIAILVGMAIGETCCGVAALAVSWRCGYWSFSVPDPAILIRTLRFSAPLMLVSVCASVMSYGDRYVLQAYCGKEVVAGYAVAYDLCGYLQVLFIASFRLSILPELVSRFTADGTASAAEFLSRAFRSLSWVLVAVAFGVVATGKDVITLLASAKYSDAGTLLVYLVPGVLLGGLSFVFASGLYLHKRNELWLGIAAVSAIFNVGMNLLLVPRYGAAAAAVNTLLTYIVQMVGCHLLSHRFLPWRVEWATFMWPTVCGMAMFLAIPYLGMWTSGVAGLAVKVLGGASIYCGLMLCLDREAKRVVWGICGFRKLAN